MNTEKLLDRKIQSVLEMIHRSNSPSISISLDWWKTSVVDTNSQSRLKSFKEVNLLKENFTKIESALRACGVTIRVEKGQVIISKYIF